MRCGALGTNQTTNNGAAAWPKADRAERYVRRVITSCQMATGTGSGFVIGIRPKSTTQLYISRIRTMMPDFPNQSRIGHGAENSCENQKPVRGADHGF